MEELIKNIREMGLENFICILDNWEDSTDLENFEEVVDELNYLIEDEMSSAPE